MGFDLCAQRFGKAGEIGQKWSKRLLAAYPDLLSKGFSERSVFCGSGSEYDKAGAA